MFIFQYEQWDYYLFANRHHDIGSHVLSSLLVLSPIMLNSQTPEKKQDGAPSELTEGSARLKTAALVVEAKRLRDSCQWRALFLFFRNNENALHVDYAYNQCISFSDWLTDEQLEDMLT